MNLGFTEKKAGRTWIVVCGNYREFNDFCKIKLQEYENGETYFEGDEFIYYSSPLFFRGLRAYGIISHGTYRERRDIDYTVLRACVNYKYRYLGELK